MNKYFAAIAAIALSACSGPNGFKVKIDDSSLGTQMLTAVYTLPDGNRAAADITIVDGRGEFLCSTLSPTDVELFLSSGRDYVAFHASGSENVSVSSNSDIKGAEIIPLSVIALSDSVSFVAPEVFVGVDSVETFPAEGVWVFTSSREQRSKAVMDTIKAYKSSVRDVVLALDWQDYRDITRRDSATWLHGMMIDAPQKVDALTFTPALIEVDSTGIKRIQRL